MDEHSDAYWLGMAVDLAAQNVTVGGGPFGAVIVRDGALVAVGQNRVTVDLDPTAHAEVHAIRVAVTVLGDVSLTGCILYASCEPCPMCLAASLWARLDRVVYAADRYDAAAAGFDDQAFYDLFNTDRSQWDVGVEMIVLPHRLLPFDRWRVQGRRVEY